MPSKENMRTLSPVDSLTIATEVGAANGAGVDLDGFESALVLCASVEGTIEFAIEHSNDDGVGDAYAAPAASQVVGGALTVTPAAGAIGKLAYIGNKRYVRVTSDGAGTVVAMVVRGHARNAPVV